MLHHHVFLVLILFSYFTAVNFYVLSCTKRLLLQEREYDPRPPRAERHNDLLYKEPVLCNNFRFFLYHMQRRHNVFALQSGPAVLTCPSISDASKPDAEVRRRFLIINPVDCRINDTPRQENRSLAVRPGAFRSVVSIASKPRGHDRKTMPSNRWHGLIFMEPEQKEQRNAISGTPFRTHAEHA